MKNLNSRSPILSRPAGCLAGVILFGGLITASLAVNPSLVRADDPNRTSYREFMAQHDFYQTQLVLETDEYLMGHKIWGSYDEDTGLYYAMNPADLPEYAAKLTKYFEELEADRQRGREIRARINALKKAQQEQAQQEQANKPAPAPPNNNPSPPASTPDQSSTKPPADSQPQPPPDQPATKVVRITHPTPPPPTPMTRPEPEPEPESSAPPEVASPATAQPEPEPEPNTPAPDSVSVDEVETQTEEIALAPLEIVSSADPASPQAETGNSVGRPILWGVAAALVTFAVLVITTLSHRRQR